MQSTAIIELSLIDLDQSIFFSIAFSPYIYLLRNILALIHQKVECDTQPQAFNRLFSINYRLSDTTGRPNNAQASLVRDKRA